MTNSANNKSPNYILGHSETELQRLISQAQFYMKLTEHLLSDAGIKPGMHVLDVGSGTGDVSFLLAKLVGSSGSVLGIDKSAEAVGIAQQRASENQLQNVNFVESTLQDFSPDQQFDVVFGRLILMYQPDPVGFVRQAADYVKPGGLIIFQELDFTGNTLTLPAAPLYEQAIYWIKEVLLRAKIPTNMGLMLYQTFIQAGLPVPEVLASSRVDGGPNSPAYDYIANSVRSLLPTMERVGVVTADQAQVETLAQRLRDEVVAGGGVVAIPHLIGAWTRK